MRPQSAQEQADEAIEEGSLRNFQLPSAMKQSKGPPPESGRESTSPAQSEIGVVERVMKAHGLTRAEAEEAIEAFGG